MRKLLVVLAVWIISATAAFAETYAPGDLVVIKTESPTGLWLSFPETKNFLVIDEHRLVFSSGTPGVYVFYAFSIAEGDKIVFEKHEVEIKLPEPPPPPPPPPRPLTALEIKIDNKATELSLTAPLRRAFATNFTNLAKVLPPDELIARTADFNRQTLQNYEREKAQAEDFFRFLQSELNSLRPIPPEDHERIWLEIAYGLYH